MKQEVWERNGTCTVTRKPSLISPVTTFLESRLKETFALLPGNSVSTGNFRNPNPWGYEKNLIVAPHGYVSRIITNSGNWAGDIYDGALGNAVGFSWPGISAPDGLRNRSLTKLNDKVQSGLNLSESLFEVGKTSKMLNLVSRATKVLEDTVPRFRRLSRLAGRVPNFGWRKTPKSGGRYVPWVEPFVRNQKTGSNLSNAYLELTFGWTPLIQDLYGTADEFVRFIENGTSQRFRGRVREPQPAIKSTMQVLGSTRNVTVTRKGYWGHSITVQLKPEHPGFDLSRWTSLNPVLWGYNLIPFSFVLDYVYDIGGYLENLEAAVMQNSRFELGFEEKLIVIEDGVRLSQSWHQAGYDHLASIYASRSYVSYGRTVLGAYPIPDRPVFTVSLGSKQLLNLAALLANLVRF